MSMNKEQNRVYQPDEFVKEWRNEEREMGDLIAAILVGAVFLAGVIAWMVFK